MTPTERRVIEAAREWKRSRALTWPATTMGQQDPPVYRTRAQHAVVERELIAAVDALALELAR